MMAGAAGRTMPSTSSWRSTLGPWAVYLTSSWHASNRQAPQQFPVRLVKLAASSNPAETALLPFYWAQRAASSLEIFMICSVKVVLPPDKSRIGKLSDWFLGLHETTRGQITSIA